MRNELNVIDLWGDNSGITLETFIAYDWEEESKPPRDAVIVAPGGAYLFLAGREAEPVARKYFGEGFNTFVLKYTVGEQAQFPKSLRDISKAICHVKEHAEEYHINPDRVFVCGFSAGGHLCASIGTMWDSDDAKIADGMPYGLNKPCGMILCYPYITLEEAYRHQECALMLSGGKLDEDAINRISCDRRVSENTVPAYMWTTATDMCVHPMNSILMVAALTKYKIPYEFHMFKEGPHGMSLATEETFSGWEANINESVATWFEESVYWMKHLPDGKQKKEERAE